VTGILFTDDNRNGILDSDEAGISNAMVTLSDGGRSLDITHTTVTDVDGIYQFTAVPLGQYIVSFILPPEYAGNLPPPISINVGESGPITISPVAVQRLQFLYLPSVQR
jgi:hypothetical protein